MSCFTCVVSCCNFLSRSVYRLVTLIELFYRLFFNAYSLFSFMFEQFFYALCHKKSIAERNVSDYIKETMIALTNVCIVVDVFLRYVYVSHQVLPPKHLHVLEFLAMPTHILFFVPLTFIITCIYFILLGCVLQNREGVISSCRSLCLELHPILLQKQQYPSCRKEIKCWESMALKLTLSVMMKSCLWFGERRTPNLEENLYFWFVPMVSLYSFYPLPSDTFHKNSPLPVIRGFSSLLLLVDTKVTWDWMTLFPEEMNNMISLFITLSFPCRETASHIFQATYKRTLPSFHLQTHYMFFLFKEVSDLPASSGSGRKMFPLLSGKAFFSIIPVLETFSSFLFSNLPH